MRVFLIVVALLASCLAVAASQEVSTIDSDGAINPEDKSLTVDTILRETIDGSLFKSSGSSSSDSSSSSSSDICGNCNKHNLDDEDCETWNVKIYWKDVSMHHWLCLGCGDHIHGDKVCHKQKHQAVKEIEDIGRTECGVKLNCHLYDKEEVVDDIHDCDDKGHCKHLLFGCDTDCDTKCRYHLSCHASRHHTSNH